MVIELKGSDLTQAMLERGDRIVWCAVSNISDKHAMETVENGYYELLVPIVSFEDGFVCRQGNIWCYAVPVKKVELNQEDVEL